MDPVIFGDHEQRVIDQLERCAAAEEALTQPEWQRCPICEGCGSVPPDFYTRLGAATSTAREQCRTCRGRGTVARPEGGPR